MTGQDVDTDATLIPLDDDLARELNAQFVQQFGPILSSEVLVKALGYRSAAAYRQAVTRDTVPVPLFQIPNRRGRFALARDVAIWLSQQRRAVTTGDRARHPVQAESNECLLERKQ